MRRSIIVGLMLGVGQLAQLGLADSSSGQTITEYRDAVVFVETEIMEQDGTNQRHETGTGFIVSPDGYIVTAAHVVPEPGPNEQAEYWGRIRSRHSSEKHRLTFIRSDPRSDVAVLSFMDSPRVLKTVRLGRPNLALLMDTELWALGFPGQSDLFSMKGLLGAAGERGWWETTLPLNYGNSGGPVFDSSFAVVAMATGGIEGAQQRTVVVPLNLLYPVLAVVPGLPTLLGQPEMPQKQPEMPQKEEAATAAIPSQPSGPTRSYWNHNGSVMYLVASGADRAFHYYEPRPAMLEYGAKPNTVVFRGRSDGTRYEGTAFVFSKRCKAKYGYRVTGPIEDDGRRVVLTGTKPQLGENCRRVGGAPDKLVFEYQRRN